MNKAQKITIAIVLIFMAFFCWYDEINGMLGYSRYEFIKNILIALFLGGAVFILFSLKKNK